MSSGVERSRCAAIGIQRRASSARSLRPARTGPLACSRSNMSASHEGLGPRSTSAVAPAPSEPARGDQRGRQRARRALARDEKRQALAFAGVGETVDKALDGRGPSLPLAPAFLVRRRARGEGGGSMPNGRSGSRCAPAGAAAGRAGAAEAGAPSASRILRHDQTEADEEPASGASSSVGPVFGKLGALGGSA